MYKLDLKQAEEPETKLPTSTWSKGKQGNPRKTCISASLTTLKPLTVWITRNSGKRWGYQTALSASSETCIQVKKQELELDTEQWVGSKLGKEYIKAVYCHPVCLTYSEYIIWNAGLDEAQAGIKTAGRNINNLRYADETILMAECEEELKLSWWGWKKRVKKLALKLIIQKTKIVPSGPITSW